MLREVRPRKREARFVGGLHFDKRGAFGIANVEHRKQIGHFHGIVRRVFESFVVEPMDETASAEPAEDGRKLDLGRKPVFDVLRTPQEGLRVGKIPIEFFGDADDRVRRIHGYKWLLVTTQFVFDAHRAISSSASVPNRLL